jgi:hypothetical protein
MIAVDRAERHSKSQLDKTIESLSQKKNALEQLKASVATVNVRVESLQKEKAEIDRIYDQIKNELLSLQETQTIAEKETRKTEIQLKEQIRKSVREKVDMELNIMRSEIMKGQDETKKKDSYSKKRV